MVFTWPTCPQCGSDLAPEDSDQYEAQEPAEYCPVCGWERAEVESHGGIDKCRVCGGSGKRALSALRGYVWIHDKRPGKYHTFIPENVTDSDQPWYMYLLWDELPKTWAVLPDEIIADIMKFGFPPTQKCIHCGDDIIHVRKNDGSVVAAHLQETHSKLVDGLTCICGCTMPQSLAVPLNLQQ